MKKLVTLLVVVAMMLTLASTAFAADVFVDVADKTDVQQSAITKLNALEIINGYPDGTFKPDNTITRAEFAKIAVIVAGMEKSADVLKNTPAQFTDVKTGAWYTGYINLAASQGYVKGYPNGTFNPNAQISYAEVVTVLLRVAGYNDNLPGAWPVDYIVKAASIDVTEDVNFNAKDAATRADVAVMGSATLDATVQAWNNDTEKFEDDGDSLLDENFDGAIVENVVITDWSYDEDEEQFTVDFDAVDIDGDDEDETTAYLAKTAKTAGVAIVADLVNHYADVIWDADEDEIAFIDVTSKVLESDDIEAVDEDEVEVDDVEYDTTFDVAEDDVFEADWYKVYVNDDNEVYAINEVAAGEDFELVDEDAFDAEEEVLYVVDGDYDFEDYDAVIVVKDGKYADLADLEENDAVIVDDEAFGAETAYIEAFSIADSGKFTAGYGNAALFDEVKIAGTKYGIAANAEISRDGGDDFAALDDSDDFDDVYSENVKFFLDKQNNIYFVIADVEGSDDDEVYGIVVDRNRLADEEDGWVNNKLTILLANGKTATYELSADADDADEVIFEAAAIDAFVAFTLDAAGDIEEIAAADLDDEAVSIGDVDEDRDMIKIDGIWYDVTADTVVFNTFYDEDNDDDEDAIVEDASVLYDAEGEIVDFIANSDGELEYVVFDTEISASEDDYALIADTYYVDGDLWATVNVRGEVNDYEVVEDGAAVVDAVYEYSFTGSKIEFDAEVDFDAVAEDYAVEGTITDYSVAGNYVKIGDDKYFVDEDTYIFDYTEEDPEYASLRAIDKNDDVAQIILTDDDDKNADVIKVLFIVDAE